VEKEGRVRGETSREEKGGGGWTEGGDAQGGREVMRG
jgi:hypothetical protein